MGGKAEYSGDEVNQSGMGHSNAAPEHSGNEPDALVKGKDFGPGGINGDSFLPAGGVHRNLCEIFDEHGPQPADCGKCICRNIPWRQ
ncbi:MAG: hypothetical protein EPN47_15825 [Acidobacteria bacterium]|nr:MAG: hypothetical protein EPN47_15825 [Acidobacteriota bacterium]